MTGIGRPFTYNPYDYESRTTSEKKEDKAFLLNSADNKLEIKVVGILTPKEGTSYGSLSNHFYYTKDFIDYVIEHNYDSEISQLIRDDVKWGWNADKGEYMNSYGQGITSGVIAGVNTGIMYSFGFYDWDYIYNDKETGFIGTLDTMRTMIGGYLGLSGANFYTISLSELGGNKYPTSLAIYAKDFESKQKILAYLDDWNDRDSIVSFMFEGEKITLAYGENLGYSDRTKITYSDTLSLIIGMIQDFISIITVALIGFTSLALIVSCVMIAIITFVSVLERTKEIGIIRSIGGSKRDVSSLFNAETFIIGFTSGTIGLAVTWLVSGVINLIVRYITPVNRIAIFPWHYALIMMGISVFLTIISGLIPASSAARKDPAAALRSI
jgi:putative ABC transport system permease protein